MYNTFVGGLINRGEYSTFSPIPTNLTGAEVLSMNTCSIPGCDKKHKAKGFCLKHYVRYKKYGDPNYLDPKLIHPKSCKVEGCNNEYKGHGYCQKHLLRHRKHGDPLFIKFDLHTKKPEYSVWSGMKSRCSNSNHAAYKNYGGRGIKVCDRWNSSFVNFYEDMGKRPTPKYQIDRIDNDGNYEPSNCRWVTAAENMKNKRRANKQ